MTTFVLVHGSWHGAWIWYKILPRLRATGHEAVAMDLPAHGADATEPHEVTFSDYVSRIGATIDEADGEVVLVAHSMGGHPATQAVERYADSLDGLVYVAAFLPVDGEALTDFDIGGIDSTVPEYASPDESRGVVEFDDAGAEDAFYQDCGDEDVALARSLLRPEPLEPRTVPVDLSERNYGSVPRAYVECTDDAAIPVAFQRSMRERRTFEWTHSLATSHSPFLSAPDRLAAALLEAAWE